jgi:hypothetical protein
MYLEESDELLAALVTTCNALKDIINASDNCACATDYCKCPLGSGPYKPSELQADGPGSFMSDCNLAEAAITKATVVLRSYGKRRE